MNFFHMDCLSSEVRLNVDLDVTLTVIMKATKAVRRGPNSPALIIASGNGA